MFAVLARRARICDAKVAFEHEMRLFVNELSRPTSFDVMRESELPLKMMLLMAKLPFQNCIQLLQRACKSTGVYTCGAANPSSE